MSKEVLPFDHDAEIAVLGWFIADAKVRRRLMGELQPEAFEGTGLGNLWAMLVDLHQREAEINPGTVRGECRKQGINVPNDVHAKMSLKSPDVNASVDAVRTMARRRWLFRQGEAMRRAALSADESPVVVAERTLRKLDEMIRRATSRGDRSGGADELTKRLEAMIGGKIANLAWPDAPDLTRVARALESGSITMLSGSPGDGKTFWLLQSLIGWTEQGVKASICMLEKPRPWHLTRCLALLAQKPDVMRSEFATTHAKELLDINAQFKPIIERLGESICEGRKIGETLGDVGNWIDAEADASEVVVVDPVSLADAGEKRWVADREFINRCIRTCERTNCRIILVTHPNSHQGPASLTSLMGGMTYQRATDTVLHVTKHDTPKHYSVMRYGAPMATTIACNRTISVFKGRNGSGGGKRFAFNFDPQTLAYVEQGLVLRESREEHEAA